MKRIATLLLVCGLLAGCGSSKFDRSLSGALLLMPPAYMMGVPMIGVLVGAGVGLVTDKDDIYLGEMVWDWDD